MFKSTDLRSVNMEEKVQKRHQQKQSGPKAKKKKMRQQGTELEQEERKRNPKAFSVHSAVRMARTFHRSVLTFIIYVGHTF